MARPETSNDLLAPSGDNIPSLANCAEMPGLMQTCVPPTTAASHLPARIADRAWSRASRLDEHAVSTAKLGPAISIFLKISFYLNNIYTLDRDLRLNGAGAYGILTKQFLWFLILRTKVVCNNFSCFSVDGKSLQFVTEFKYLGLMMRIYSVKCVIPVCI